MQYLHLFLSSTAPTSPVTARPTLSQLWSFKICRTIFLNFIQFTHLLILGLSNWERAGRESLLREKKEKWRERAALLPSFFLLSNAVASSKFCVNSLYARNCQKAWGAAVTAAALTRLPLSSHVFIILFFLNQPQNLPVDIFYVVQKLPWNDFEASKIVKFSVGLLTVFSLNLKLKRLY